MKVFDELLLDADWSVNAGTWMWMSGSSFFQTIFHSYCPVNYGRKIDPNGDYIRKYLPILKNIPTQYIHEPWKAPLSVQQKANCVIGKNYPIPMIDYMAAGKINTERMRQVLASLSTPNQKVKSPKKWSQKRSFSFSNNDISTTFDPKIKDDKMMSPICSPRTKRTASSSFMSSPTAAGSSSSNHKDKRIL